MDVPENKVLRLFGYERAIIRRTDKLHNGKLHNLWHSSPNIVEIKSKRKRLTDMGHKWRITRKEEISWDPQARWEDVKRGEYYKTNMTKGGSDRMKLTQCSTEAR